MKKILCFMLAALMLVLGVACDGGTGDGGNTDPIQNDGVLTAEGIKDVRLYEWNVDARRGTDSTGIYSVDAGNATDYDGFLSYLSSGCRVFYFQVSPKITQSTTGKKATKISFYIESDRDVTLTIQAVYSSDIENKPIQTVSLKAGVKQNVSFALDAELKYDKRFDVTFYQNNDCSYEYTKASFESWSQTVYKITDLKCYVQ